MEIVVQQRDRALQKIGDSAQNKHVFKLSKGLSKIMENVLKNKSESIKRNLEKLIVENLQCIYRKDNLITHIEVEDDFQFNLYQNVKYSNIELIHLIKNLGKEKFASEVGKRGMERLLERYKVKTVSQLQKALEMDTVRNSHSLFKRIDINRLSKENVKYLFFRYIGRLLNYRDRIFLLSLIRRMHVLMRIIEKKYLRNFS